MILFRKYKIKNKLKHGETISGLVNNNLSQ